MAHCTLHAARCSAGGAGFLPSAMGAAAEALAGAWELPVPTAAYRRADAPPPTGGVGSLPEPGGAWELPVPSAAGVDRRRADVPPPIVTMELRRSLKHASHTRFMAMEEVVEAEGSTTREAEQASQKIWPHLRQWWRRRNSVKGASQPVQAMAKLSGTHSSRPLISLAPLHALLWCG